MRPDNTVLRTPGSPIRFAVDDVQASTDRLPTAVLLDVMREKLSREVLLCPVGTRSVNAWSNNWNPLVDAVHVAFSRHLPLLLSPDMIWLTILQGFSHHVRENAESLRGRLVRHQGSLTLYERIKDLTLEEVEGAISGFSRQIREATDPVLHETLLCNFTTTTPEVHTASEIALMDTYSHYFEFSFMKCICGIPHITLSGSVQDWQGIRDRVEVLETFGLDWWVSPLRPILDEFVRAAEGHADPEFWQGIYKYRPPEARPYEQGLVTGWLVNLFPYLSDIAPRSRNPAIGGEKREVSSGAFPSGLCSVDAKLGFVNDEGQILDIKELELVAGLMGVEQALEDGAVYPVINWCLTTRAPHQSFSW